MTIQKIPSKSKRATAQILAELQKNGMALRGIKNPTRQMQLAAVEQNGDALCFIEDQTPEICLAAVRQNGFALQYVAQPFPEVLLEALKNCSPAILFIPNPLPEHHLAAVRADDCGLRFIKHPSAELCAEAVRHHGCSLKYVFQQTPDICMDAVKQDGLALEFVFEQTPALCLAAVHQNGLALRFAFVQTPALCLAAVEKNGLALEYVKKQTSALCLAAVQHDSSALKHVRNQSREICLAAVSVDGLALQYVHKQTPEICHAAVRENCDALDFVKERTPVLEGAAYSDARIQTLLGFGSRQEAEAYWLAEVRESGWALRSIPIQSPELCLAAVEQDARALQLVYEQTPELCAAAIKKMPFALQFVRDQTERLCMAAVVQNPAVLRHVKIQTPALCMAAVKRDGNALEHFKPETPMTLELCMAAIRNCGVALKFVRAQTLEMCFAAVQDDARAINFVEVKTLELCMIAVQARGMTLKFIKEQTASLCLAAVQNDPNALEYVTDEDLKENFRRLEVRWKSLPESEAQADQLDSKSPEALSALPALPYPDFWTAAAEDNSISIEVISPTSMLALRELAKGFEGDRKQRSKLERIINAVESGNVSGQRPAQVILSPDIDCTGFPNFEEVAQYISIYIRARYQAKQPFKIPHILLEGAPGIGKTEFLSHVCQQLSIPFAVINMASLDTGSHIGGSQIHWDNCRHGIVAEHVLIKGQPNPLIFIDEIDKATQRNSNHPLSALYALLENTSAKTFEDASLPGVPFNASHISWAASCNDKSLIPPPILSRFRTFEILEPSRSHMQTIVPLIFKNILTTEQWSDVLTEPLGKDVLDALSGKNPRLARKALSFAAARAVADQRKHVVVSDLQIEATPYKIGFTA